MSDHPEAREIRAGDHGAFDRLYDRYAPRIMGYLLRLTGNRVEAEDLTQETFLAAYSGRSTWREDGQPLAWLLGIARRRWRDGRRHPGISAEPLLDDTPARHDLADQVTAATTLQDALDRLPEAEREVLLLTAVAGLTYAEAARVLGQPVGTVKWRVHEATRKLRQVLNAAEERYDAQTEAAKQPVGATGRSGSR